MNQRALTPATRHKTAPVDMIGLDEVLPSVYFLSRARTIACAIEYLSIELPERFFPALARHLVDRPALLDPAIRDAALAYIDADEDHREAYAVFARM